MSKTQLIVSTITSEDSQLRRLREARGMSRREIAEKLGVSIPAVQDYERNEAAGKITLTTLRKYAAVLDCDVALSITPRSGSIPSPHSKSPVAQSTQPQDREVPSSSAPEDPIQERMGLWSASVGD